MAKRSGKLRNLQQGNAVAGYLFISPFIIGFIFFEIYPLLQSLYLSFCEVKVATGGFETTFVNIANYKKAFTIDAYFNQMLVEELRNMAINVPVTLIFAFFIALLLNQEFKGRGLVRAIFFLPVILSSGVMVGLEYNNSLLNGIQDIIRESSNSTTVTSTLEEILTVSGGGLGRDALNVVFDAINRVYDIAMASGIQIIVFLSGLQTITTSMYEAAKIEGATAWETFWKITFPMISSLILVNLVYTVIDCFLNSNSNLMNKITTTMSRDLDYGFSSAMAWVYMVVVVAVIGILSWIISKRVYYYD
ncbi:MAG: sugar ABC transporter permease [Lachnospiraceae bacterium]|nr:sugar ABC transporter permease [Lachnospiraceae bacterium]